MLPTTTCDQATPLIWTVGSASAVTVVGVAAEGAGGAESARAAAGVSSASAPATSRMLSPAESVRSVVERVVIGRSLVPRNGPERTDREH
ncbi:hypothetical protein A7K94_0202180 [Modestobacter sp. VKM Ac-2676]|nr:hypothetical protein A7K94_0202180 [Modestobacter sp. VKM Ac-2676]